MEKTERLMVTQSIASMDSSHKALFYEVKKKNTGLITLLSLVIPGGGQIYLGEYVKGVLILLFSWLIVTWLYGIYDAHKTADKYNKDLYTLIFSEPVSIAPISTNSQIQEQK